MRWLIVSQRIFYRLKWLRIYSLVYTGKAWATCGYSSFYFWNNFDFCTKFKGWYCIIIDGLKVRDGWHQELEVLFMKMRFIFLNALKRGGVLCLVLKHYNWYSTLACSSCHCWHSFYCWLTKGIKNLSPTFSTRRTDFLYHDCASLTASQGTCASTFLFHIHNNIFSPKLNIQKSNSMYLNYPMSQ